MTPPSPPRRLTLHGRAFSFHGIARHSSVQWTRILEARGATVLPRWQGHATPVVVLTDWWVDTLPAAATISDRVVCVTEFWLRESLKRGEWLHSDAHPFFSPPAAINASPLLLTYPMDYDDQRMTSTFNTTSTILARLPCSPLNLYEDVVPLWPYFVAYLREPTTTTSELIGVLKRITGESRHSLNCLQVAIDDLLAATDRQALFDVVLPTMKTLVMEFPYSFRHSLLLLPPITVASSSTTTPDARLHEACLHLSRLQLLPLLCAMFLAVFPAQNHVPHVEFPWFDMEQMFHAPRSMPDVVLLKAHKIRTILEYFLRVVPRYLDSPNELEYEIVTFTRVAIQPPPAPASVITSSDPADVASSLLQSLTVMPTVSAIMRDVQIETNVLIEDLAAHLQIDFANKYAGGGVMNGGAVQEEIRFLLSPELMVACLVFARLDAHESFVIHGSERFSTYAGYGGSFRYAASMQDTTPFETLDSNHNPPQRRRQSVVVGIDAISYGGNTVARQYSRRCIVRDLTKALVGFAYPEAASSAWPIATGNWGCGVFRGDPELKFLIQWVAASLVGRPMVYVIFEQTSDLQDRIRALLHACRRCTSTMGPQLMRWLVEFMLGLEAQLVPSSPSRGSAGRTGNGRNATRNEGRRGRDERGARPPTRRHSESSVLERAVAFVETKAAAWTRRTIDTTEEETPPSLSPSVDTTAISSAMETTMHSPPMVNPRHRTSGDTHGSKGGSQLKQPKLTSFWK